MTDEELSKFKEEFMGISGEILSDGRLSERSAREWRKSEGKIRRRFDLFGTDLLFIVATGMLKAGKSTFVNLLSRSENASPIGFGVDTTLRPALIKMAARGSGSRGGIYVYKRKPVRDAESEMRELQEQMENIIDRIKGLKEFDEEYPDVQPKELNQANLRKILCSRPGTNELLDQSPLLVVVEVPFCEDSRVFSENCVVFDMPGLDSNDAEISRNFEMYNAVFKECDLVLFIQSNVSPVNDAACGYLAKIGRDRSSCTYRLVQNRMRAKYWQEEGAARRELEEQAENGIRNFVKKLSTNRVSESSLKSWSANLGMAYDAIFRPNDVDSERFPPEELLAESGFLGMEENLLSDIVQNGKEQRRSHCRDELCNDLRDVAFGMERKVASLKAAAERKEAEVGALVEEKNAVESYARLVREESWTGCDFNLSDDLRRQIETELRDCFKRLRASTKYCDVLKEKVSSFRLKGSRYDEFLIECSAAARSLVLKILGESYIERVDSGRDDAVKILNRKIEEIMRGSGKSVAPVPKVEYRTRTVGAIPESVRLELAKIEPHREDGRFLFVAYEREIEVNDSMLSDEYDKIIAHYVRESRSVLKAVMGGIMTEVCNSHVASHLRGSLAEKDAEIAAARAELDALSGEREVFSLARERLRRLEGRLEEVPV